MTQKTTLFFVLLFFAFQISLAQSLTQEQITTLGEAIKLMDNGKLDASIEMLKKAQKSSPNVFDYQYEMGYAYYLKKDYKEAIKILTKLTSHKDVSDLTYQLLGNSYDMMGDSKKALEMYEAGLKKFPKSGSLYLEEGNIYFIQQKYEESLPFYEEGIRMDPTFPSNYYRAALLYCNSTEKVWGLMYGEIFLNLERGSVRTAEISKLMYDTYLAGIEWTSDTNMSIKFSKNIVIVDEKPGDGELEIPFSLMYENTIGIAAAMAGKVNLNSLSNIRNQFLKSYFAAGNDKKFPNVLFDYQKKIADAGHANAYNHWVLMRGDEAAFSKWAEEHSKEIDDFVAWFKVNRLELDNTHKFYRKQY